MARYPVFEATLFCFVLIGTYVSALPAAPLQRDVTDSSAWAVYIAIPIITGSGAAAKAAASQYAQQACSNNKTIKPKYAYYAQETETPAILDIVAQFDTLATAQAFQASVQSGTIYKVLEPKLTGPITAYVVTLSPATPLRDLTTAPNTEVAIFWLPENATPAIINGFNAAFGALRTAVAAASGQLYITDGYIQGTAPNPADRNTQVVLALVGWQSLEAHNAFAQSPAFGPAVAGLAPFISGTTDHNDALSKVHVGFV
ncbi:MAG: hypothetical protein Q9214_002230 [Letrouitia sp. 1 TL-2023]